MKYTKEVTREVLDTDALTAAIEGAKIRVGIKMDRFFGGYHAVVGINNLRLTMSNATLRDLASADRAGKTVATDKNSCPRTPTYCGLPVDLNDSLSFGDIRIATELDI